MANFNLGVNVQAFDGAVTNPGVQYEVPTSQLWKAEYSQVLVVIGSGDTVELQGNFDGGATYYTIDTWTASDMRVISLPPFFRFNRTAGSTGSTAFVFTPMRPDK